MDLPRALSSEERTMLAISMHPDLNRLVTDLVAHLRENPAWIDGCSHEGWIAAETASFFRRKHSCGVGREVPYLTTAADGTKYADVYVHYVAAEQGPVHLFFEYKCVGELAAPSSATLSKFAADVDWKLACFDVEATRAHWKTSNEAWCENLGDLRSTIYNGRIIGIGVLFCAVTNDARREQLAQVQKRLHDASGKTTLLVERELPPNGDEEKWPILCLAYSVNVA